MSIVTSLWGEGSLKMAGEWTPFLKRIDPKEFLIVENKISESLSDTCDLVIYETSQKSVYLSVGLTRLAGKGSRLEVEYREPRSLHPLTKPLILPPDITDRLFSVIEFALTNQVYAPTGKAIQNLEDSCDWINLRIDKKTSASGMVYIPFCGNAFESSQPFWDLITRLKYCAAHDSSAGPPLLMLDLAIDRLRLSYPAKK